jgi:dienelactone hydrolase
MSNADDRIEDDFVALEGTLTIPVNPRAIVVFAHAGGGSRCSPQNRRTAAVLEQGRMATLIFDLLTPSEQTRDGLTAEYRSNIPLLTRRLVGTLNWLSSQPEVALLPIGLFGAKTAAAAALAASTEITEVHALVLCAGCTDFARDALSSVAAPTLMIVGERDGDVLRPNRDATDKMICVHRIEIVPGSTHLFDEPDTREIVEHMAVQWFESWLAQGVTP